MKTILISGCSYGQIFDHLPLQQYIKNKFKVEKIVNLSRTGSSVDRQIKTVMEWLATNPFPDLVLMPLTHVERYDESVSNRFDPAMALDESLCVSMDPFVDDKQMNNRFQSRIDLQTMNALLKNKTLVYNDRSAFNNFVTKIITFSGWLQHNRIRHVLFNMCNLFDKDKFSKIKKQQFLNGNKNVIDLFSFCGNTYMHENLTDEQRTQEKIGGLGAHAHHYNAESNKVLINYLNSYIIEHNI